MDHEPFWPCHQNSFCPFAGYRARSPRQPIPSGAVFRPAAVIVGASVILFDHIFQGLAISLMAGEVASLLLSRMTVPILYYLSERRRYRRKQEEYKE
jgi:hypothetical protein